MTRDDDVPGWGNRWARRSVAWLLVLTAFSVLVGFVWLPSVQPDFTARGLWDSLCRAAGVPAKWGDPAMPAAGLRSTDVVLDRAMAQIGGDDAIGRGATLALNCTMCHGAQGITVSDAPNLAGQYPEVVVKQLRDYRSGHRASAIMAALAARLSDRDIDDLAAYYAYLPKFRTAPTTYGDALPRLVRVGDPLRNIAPCISCHGSVDQKLGAPWLEGMPRQYLLEQLTAFRAGTRRNDSHAQMRNMVTQMTTDELTQVTEFYARRGKAESK